MGPESLPLWLPLPEYAGHPTRDRSRAVAAGLGTDPAFQNDAGESVIDTRRLFYDGNSQGGIIGGALAAVGVDHDRAVLGVPGMNYSTLLRRSVDEFGQTIVMVTHDPTAASYADRIVFLADGRVVDEMFEPTAEKVLERMKRFGE